MPDDGTTPPRAQREIALDAIRSAALVRVVIWHTFGAAAITYVDGGFSQVVGGIAE